MHKRHPVSTDRRKVPAQTLFFPAAALYAALLVPLSLWAMFHPFTPWAGVASGLGHGRELLFGFALAVIAGYLLGPLPRRRLILLFALWLVARLASLLAPAGPVALLAGTLFALGLAWHVVPRFRAARKWRNRLQAPLLLAICLAAAASLWAALANGGMNLQHMLTYQGVLLLTLLMLFMGGRVIAPAAAGHQQRLGMPLAARVQPRFEGGIIVVMLAAIVLAGWPAGRAMAGLMLVTAGLLALVRLLRWRLWRCRGRWDLLGLGVGYTWLALGLVVNGAALWQGRFTIAPIHLVTLGALGTLSGVIMMRTTLLRTGGRDVRVLSREWRFAAFVGMVGLATVLRLAAPLEAEHHASLLWSAAAAWSLAWLLVALRLTTAELHGR